MNKDILKQRTKDFAIRTIRYTDMILLARSGNYICGQLLRSATSVGANYRAALRGKSKQDFHYKIKLVLEEVDESVFWLELLQETKSSEDPELSELLREANELTSIFSATCKTLQETR